MTVTRPELGFVHRFVPATDTAKPPLLLLHGTGGDESDLLALGAQLSPGAALLSPRGKVLENGMPRFFRRLAEGVFDLDDLKARTLELADFVQHAREVYDIAPPIAVGFSNGANIAASILLLRPQVLAGALLMRAMTPFAPPVSPDLSGLPILMLSGAADPIVPERDRDRLAAIFTAAGAEVSHEIVPGGHGLSAQDVQLGKWWLASRFAAKA